ncbi:MAG: hypothetical protein OEO77_13645 [Acidimicrobiia bacterium]|nr:hypothetical protein [Acidimicrobiia bacterium]
MLSKSRHTVEDGLIVREEFLGSPDPAAFDNSLTARFDAITAYEKWVLNT